MQQYAVPLAYVDGQKLALLALDPLAERDETALVECLVNKDQVAGAEGPSRAGRSPERAGEEPSRSWGGAQQEPRRRRR